MNVILKNRWCKTWLINYFKKCSACISYFIESQFQSLIKISPRMLFKLAAILTLGEKPPQKIIGWPSVCNYLICCSYGLSWTSISKGMKIVVKLVPCLSFFSLLCPPSLPPSPSVFFSFSLIVPGGVQEGWSSTSLQFSSCVIFDHSSCTRMLLWRGGREAGGKLSGLWGGLRLLAFPCLVATHNMSGTQDISMPQLPLCKSHARPLVNCFFKEVACNLVRATSHLPC